MGGRGASSGISNKGKRYGTEYHSVLQSGNIKFVKYNHGSATSPLETMTKGRVYVTVNEKDILKSITFYDKNNKKYKQVDIGGHFHVIDGEKKEQHTHYGYIHDEKGTKNLTTKEQKMLERVIKIWENHLNRK